MRTGAEPAATGRGTLAAPNPEEAAVPTTTRALILVAPLALALGACGDDDDPPDNSEPDVSAPDVSSPDSPELTLPGGSVPDLSDLSIPDGITIPEGAEDAAMESLTGLGLTEDQAQCLIDEVGISEGQVPQMNEMMTVLDECGVNIADLQPGG